MHNDYADVEIRLRARQSGGYPIELTVNGEQQFAGGRLAPDYTVDAGLPQSGSFRLAWAKIEGRHPRRRVRLRIDPAAAELHGRSWEQLSETVTGSGVAMAAASATPFSRYLESERPAGRPLRERPLKMLLAIANPSDLLERWGLSVVRVAAEQQLFAEAVSETAIELTVLPQPCTLSALEAELRRGYHILHFVGHGQSSNKGEATALLLADEQNQTVAVKAADFVALLRRQQADAKLRLICLASCDTAEAPAAAAYHSMAQQLVQQAGIPAVVAMQGRVSVATARQFSQSFYHRLAHHGLVDVAANEARATLATAQRPDAAVPVLFMRLRDGQLFAPPPPGHQPNLERLSFEPETVYIPAGPFLMGDVDDPYHKSPRHEVELPAYRMGKYPVTVAEYAEFIKQNPHQPEPKTGWFLRQPGQTLAQKLAHPVVQVNYYDAAVYCQWLSEESGRLYRLPTEAEWEKAARGPAGYRYPWGDEWRDDLCNTDGADTMSVDAFPEGASGYGCCDLVGNVREWTATLWEGDPDRRVQRGGAYQDDPAKLSCVARSAAHAESRFTRSGFRVVMEL